MTFLGLLAFAFAGVSLALVLGSGAGRFRDPDDPAMLWVGLGFFGLFCVTGLIVKLGTSRPPLEGRRGPTIAIVACAVVGGVVGIVLDASN